MSLEHHRDLARVIPEIKQTSPEFRQLLEDYQALDDKILRIEAGDRILMDARYHDEKWGAPVYGDRTLANSREICVLSPTLSRCSQRSAMTHRHTRAHWLYMLLLLPVLLGGCTYYQAAPGTYTTTTPTSFDRSWTAVLGAFADQGVSVTREDRAAGMVQGTRNGIVVTANVDTQADGSVRVGFKTSREIDRDPDLIDRIASAYDRRMGR